jgi:uncharacterized RDD family membrane protein YckC
VPRDDREVRDPTRVVWRRCFAWGTGLVLTVLSLVVTLYVAGDVHKEKAGCPRTIPAGQNCVEYRSVGYLMRDRVFIWFAVTLIVMVLVIVVLPHVVVGSSLGKALFGIRVVRADGSAPGVLRASIRTVAWVVDAFSLLLPVGLWLAIFTPRHRRVGDYLAGTYVVRRSAAGHRVPVAARHRPRWSEPPVAPGSSAESSTGRCG